MTFSSIQSVFSRVSAKYGLQGEFEAAHVCHAYEKIVKQCCGEKLATKTAAKYLKNNFLWVSASGASASQKLQMSLHNILRKLQELFGKERIKSIRIVQEARED
jgi:hypothetical protein